MSTPVVTPNADPAVQTTPTQAGMPHPVPVQPRDEGGRFANVPQAAPTPAPTPVAAPVAPVTPPVPTPAAPPAPYATEDLGNGRMRVKFMDEVGAETGVYEGTHAELIPKMADALHKTKQWGYGLNQQLKSVQPTQPVAPIVTPPTSSRFADTVEENAANQLLDLVAKAANYSSGQELLKVLSHTTATADDYQSNQLSISFQAAQPDFNGIPENVTKLAQTIGQAVGGDEAWAQMNPAQQLHAMRQAHAFNIQNKIYEARPAQAATPNVPIPPPPVPRANAPQDQFSGIPAELIPTVNDTQAQILAKIDKQRQMGLIQ